MTIANYWIKDPLFVYLVNIFRFEAMAIGGLGAYFIFHRNKSLNTIFVYNKTVQVLIYSTLIIFLVFHSNIHHPVWNVIFNTPIFSSLLINFLFLYLIVGVSLIDHNLFKFRNKFLSYLGEISYGIYMYHLLIIFGMIQFLKTILMNLSPSISTIVYYGILTISVILVASASKLLFENYFLNLKKKVEKSQIN